MRGGGETRREERVRKDGEEEKNMSERKGNKKRGWGEEELKRR